MLPFALLIISFLFQLLRIIMIVYCVFSWFIRDPSNKFFGVLSAICDPILNPIRMVLGKIEFLQRAPIDFSPVVLMMLCSLLIRILL